MSIVRKWNCDSCVKSFNQRQSLSRHKKVCSKKSNQIEKFQCETCAKLFYRKDVLKKHLKICNGIRSEPICHRCKKKFKTNWHLNRHVSQVHVRDTQPTQQPEQPCSSHESMPENVESLIDLAMVLDLGEPAADDDFIPSMVDGCLEGMLHFNSYEIYAISLKGQMSVAYSPFPLSNSTYFLHISLLHISFFA